MMQPVAFGLLSEEEQGLFSGEASALTPTPAAPGGLVVRVTPGGRLEWVVPGASSNLESEVDTLAPASQPASGADVISAREQALINANRTRIAELRTRAYPSPDLGDIITDIMGRSHPPTVSLAAAGWILQATGLVPRPVVGSALLAASAVGYVSRQFEHRLHTEHVPPQASDAATRLWQSHPHLVAELVVGVMYCVIASIKNAMDVDDTELEDELDAFYPRWSRTDFEFDPRYWSSRRAE
jgi:hypothetical protein